MYGCIRSTPSDSVVCSVICIASIVRTYVLYVCIYALYVCMYVCMYKPYLGGFTVQRAGSMPPKAAPTMNTYIHIRKLVCTLPLQKFYNPRLLLSLLRLDSRGRLGSVVRPPRLYTYIHTSKLHTYIHTYKHTRTYIFGFF